MTLRVGDQSGRYAVLAAAGLGFALSLCLNPGPAAAAPWRQSQSAPERAAACAALKTLAVPSGVVDASDWVAKGSATPGGVTAGVAASSDLCRVRLSLHPVEGSNIKVEVWLPDHWNAKLYAIGGAGFDGGLNSGGAALLNRAIAQGYAAVANDAGHEALQNPSLKLWAHKQPEKVEDFGHRANHLAALAIKQFSTAYYGAKAQHAYFLGCSNGGRDGLMEASRYPDDYDGIVAGAPARRYVEVVTQLIWYSQLAHGSGGVGLGTKAALVQNAFVQQCDGLDGAKDGIVENPRACRFDLASLQCKAGDAPTCLTADEVAAFRKVHAGPRLKSGELVIHGPALGAEGVRDNWDAWITGPTPALAGQEFYGWVVHDDPDWRVGNFKLDEDYPVALKRTVPVIDAQSTDLRAFAQRGGKLIIYQGWGDPAITPDDTIDYVEAVHRKLGAKAAGQVRLFMVPTMGHCAGGEGATSFDMQPVLENWVEQGAAPERVVATKPASGEPPFTHPLCVWPKTARYSGSGSPREATNFTCKAEQ